MANVRHRRDFMTDNTAKQGGRRWNWLIIGCVIFGILMGARAEFHSIWVRAAVAGCAFIVLGFSLLRFRMARP